MLSNAATGETQDGTEWQPGAAALDDALQHILASTPFRTSRQCQDLLRYIVKHSIGGDDAALRERIIGVKVFGRQPTYDTSQDPVVRIRAADVRKKLAQYYQAHAMDGAEVHSGVRLDLQPGSYRAHFREEPASAATPPASPPADFPPPPNAPAKRPGVGRRNKTVVACMVLLALGLSGFFTLRSAWMTPQRRFWAPFLRGQQPVLLYLGSNAAYILSPEYLAKYRGTHGLANTGPEFFVSLPPADWIRASDLMPVRDTFVTAGDLAATVQLTTMISNWRSGFTMRSGSDLSFGDLRNKPSVMIGGFNNPWTLELTNDLPYSLRQGTRIEQRGHPAHAWTPRIQPDKTDTDDYALVSRLLQSKTGGPVMIVAGVGEYGTQAAAEFVSNPKRMRELLRSAPHGWENENMEAVLHVTVVGAAPVAIEVVATSYW